MPVKGFPLQFIEKFPDSRLVPGSLGAFGPSVCPVRLLVCKGQVFFYKGNGVDAESGNSLLQPPVDHLIQLLPKCFILPV